MSGPTFTLPPQIVDVLVEGLIEAGPNIYSEIRREEGVNREVWMMTDAGPITIIRGPDMERT